MREAILGFLAAERDGDWFLAETWVRHLEFIRDLARLQTVQPV